MNIGRTSDRWYVGTRLPNSEHTDQPSRIHEIAADFHLEDVRALPTPGGPDDFEQFVRMGERMAGEDHKPTDGWAWPTPALWDLRRQLGRLLGWDRPEHDLGARVSSLRDRLPADLREGPTAPVPHGTVFRPACLTDNEMAWELSNKTVHYLSHYDWVPTDRGAIGPRWPRWSNRTACWGGPTWPGSGRFAT